MRIDETVQDEETFDAEFAAPLPPRRSIDRRQVDRRYLNIPLRFLFEGGEEQTGRLRDISSTGIGVQAEAPPPLDTHIIVYIDKIGRFEGIVVRSDAAGFGVKMALSESKRGRFEAAVDAYLRDIAPDAELSDRRDGVDDRREDARHSIGIDEIMAVAASGETFSCSIVNLSLSGVEIATRAQLDLGARVTVGVVDGVIVRKTDEGYAVKRDDGDQAA